MGSHGDSYPQNITEHLSTCPHYVQETNFLQRHLGFLSKPAVTLLQGKYKKRTILNRYLFILLNYNILFCRKKAVFI